MIGEIPYVGSRLSEKEKTLIAEHIKKHGVTRIETVIENKELSYEERCLLAGTRKRRNGDTIDLRGVAKSVPVRKVTAINSKTGKIKIIKGTDEQEAS